MLYLSLWLVCGVGAAAIAASKGRNFIGWLACGLLLGPIAILIVGFMAKAGPDKSTLRKCPFCAETILKEAVVCKHCGREIPVDLVEKVESRRCPHCREAMPADQMKCPHCGRRSMYYEGERL